MQHIFDQYKNLFKLCEARQLCPELVRNRRQVVHGYGDRNADFVFIGETPGEKGADLTGVPFTQDRSGKRLQRLLIQLGLSKETDVACESPRLINCYVTNLVRCNPPRNRNPTKGESENCQPYLAKEIRRIGPKVVIPIGNFATRWVFQNYREVTSPPITQVHAKIFGGNPFAIVPMKHPARISHRMLAEMKAVLQSLIGNVNGKVDESVGLTSVESGGRSTSSR